MISVCMATYNGAKYIKEQVDSILVQLSPNDELIVSDDGSTDNTIQILQSYNDSRIKVFPNTNKNGVNSNFENAISKASGDYIFLSDQDDVWSSDKVAVCLNELQTVELVFHDAVVWNGKETLHESYFKLRNCKNGFVNNMIKSSYVGCCMAFKKDILPKLLPFPRTIHGHDIYIGLICNVYYKVSFLDSKLIFYRRHGNNASSVSEKSKNSIFKMFSMRWGMLIAVLSKL